MRDRLLSFLYGYNKKTVSLGEFEKLAGGDTCYEDFATVVLEYTNAGVLVPIKSRGTSMKNSLLRNSCRIVIS